MEKLQQVRSIAVSWLLPNIDTDVISPMSIILRHLDELGKYAFAPYRFIDGDIEKAELSLEFPLNQNQYKNAKILFAGENFGCGSSRETAPMAILDMGIRCIIAPSFGNIFFNNCFQQGILPIALPADLIHRLSNMNGEFVVDLEKCEISCPSGESIAFEVGNLRRRMLLEGLDDVGVTLERKDTLLKYLAKDQIHRPWVYQ